MLQCWRKNLENVNNSDEIVGEESMQAGKNIENKDDDGLADFENLLESPRFVEPN